MQSISSKSKGIKAGLTFLSNTALVIRSLQGANQAIVNASGKRYGRNLYPTVSANAATLIAVLYPITRFFVIFIPAFLRAL